MTDRQSTHAADCWAWGPGHYKCAVREIERLRTENERLREDAERWRALREMDGGEIYALLGDCDGIHPEQADAAIDRARGKGTAPDAPFAPDWVSPPGDTIADVLEERGWTQAELARRLGYTEKHVSQLISGKAAITEDTASRLERVLGSTAGFWLRREAAYRARLERQQFAQQPAAVDEAMVERIAALLYEEATDEPWAVAGVEHPGPDRDYYRGLARKVAALSAHRNQQPAQDVTALVEALRAEVERLRADTEQWARIHAELADAMVGHEQRADTAESRLERAAALLRQALPIVQQDAESLHDSHTIRGEWDEESADVREVYEDEMKIVVGIAAFLGEGNG
jgi:addiction module HigA family antidote